MRILKVDKLIDIAKGELNVCISKVECEVAERYASFGVVYTDIYPVQGIDIFEPNIIRALVSIAPFCDDRKEEIDDENELIGDFYMRFFDTYIQLNCNIGMNVGKSIIDIANKRIDYAEFQNPEKELTDIVRLNCNKVKEGYLALLPKIGGNLYVWLKELMNVRNEYFYDIANKYMKEKNYQEAIKMYRHILKEQLAMTNDDWHNYADCAKGLGLADEYNLAVARQK